ncbi:protein CLEC16A [Lingula anatina]|uniref:Protein CLEC16A n=1 Tax=Lingula anatina TaxID=7574 RepID=A0A1S3HH86_LINAN|nr:protein CLEC16A [Lingula anatina]|eukprot:XP_013384394.1 protein CLEC16A [Lingula anatina]
MFSRPRSWLSGGVWKPKNPHSLEHLKFLYTVLCKNQTVTEGNRSMLVETLRSISEILIWGDQNDSSVFDFFLEKNMLSFFQRYMRQKGGRYLCVQLLQTLNILFENISNETSLYYLLSNNHINTIIVHKFDFSDEEVMAYYISFLKTLSLKLNKHTIHFFYNEHTNDFPLYTEAIKFFNHSESMVRIAVRTITLNVYKVEDKSMLRYIRDKTAAPYFSNLVWFIGNHIIELNNCVRNDADHQSRDRLADLVAEHLDHLHYLNDILCLNIDSLNAVLTDHLLNRLLLPLYVYSLTKRRRYSNVTDERPHVSSVVSLFLLSQVFLILQHSPLVRQLADIIFNADCSILIPQSEAQDSAEMVARRGFIPPTESLAQVLDNNRAMNGSPGPADGAEDSGNRTGNSTFYTDRDAAATTSSPESDETSSPAVSAAVDQTESTADDTSPNQNSTDEEKLLGSSIGPLWGSVEQRQADFNLANRPYLEAILNALECRENDYEALFALCLLYALGSNTGINQDLLDSVLMPTNRSARKDHYNIIVVERLLKIINQSVQYGSKVRLATLEMCLLVLQQLVCTPDTSYLQDRHLAIIEGSKEESMLLLRNFFKSEEIFLDMFEDEYRDKQIRPLNVEYLTMDASILLPPTGTPLTGIGFNKRLPCGEVEKARRAIRVYFLLRDLSFTLRQEREQQLPLTQQEECVKLGDVLDLNNSDLIGCTVIARDNKRERRFLVVDVLQLILVEPDTKRLGWGVVKFVGFLQDVEVSGDKDDSRTLHVTLHKPSSPRYAKSVPLLTAKFIFDDHIRCMAAKQRLTKGRLKARQRKMQMIAQLLEMPAVVPDAQNQAGLLTGIPGPGSVHRVSRGHSDAARQGRSRSHLPSQQQRAGRMGGAQRQVEGATSSGPSVPMPSSTPEISIPTTVSSSEAPQGSPGIEEAVDATSPSAFAYHLNDSVNGGNDAQRSGGNGRNSGRHSRNSSVGSNLGNHSEEIPLEDMSGSSSTRLRGVSTVSKSSSDSSGSRGRMSNRTVQSLTRSSSYSPRRGRSGSSPTAFMRAPSRSGQDKVRSRSLSGGNQPDQEQTAAFAHSLRLSAALAKAKNVRSGSGSSKGSRGSAKFLQTSFTQSSNGRQRSSSKDSSDSANSTGSRTVRSRHRSGSCELSNQTTVVVDSELSNGSATSTQEQVNNNLGQGKPNHKPSLDGKDGSTGPSLPFKFGTESKPTAEVTHVTADLSKLERSVAMKSSASDQLGKLAQAGPVDQPRSNDTDTVTVKYHASSKTESSQELYHSCEDASPQLSNDEIQGDKSESVEKTSTESQSLNDSSIKSDTCISRVRDSGILDL